MCVRIPLGSRSIPGVSSSRALLGFPVHHLCAFLIDGCVATKQQKKTEILVTRKNPTWSNWRFVTKTFERKHHFLRETPSSSPGTFFWKKCKFRPQTVPHSWVTVLWLWSFSGLRCVVAIHVNKNKNKKVKTRSTSSERTNQHPVKEINQTQEQSIWLNQWGNRKRWRHVTKVVYSGEDLSNGDLVFNLPHPRVE